MTRKGTQAVHPPIDEEVGPSAAYRHLRTALTLLLLVTLVSLAGWYSWGVVTDSAQPEEPRSLATSPVCAVAAPTDAPPPRKVRLNIYNATDRNGLASNTARLLRERGFAVLDVANDPHNAQVRNVAQVRGNPELQPAIQLVMAQVPGATYVPDERDDGTIDLVLGRTFTSLSSAGKSPAGGAGSTPLPTC